ncbi:serine hydrolase-like protein isoform X1 [Daphnia carinata]|uniref:serine hydrolase-like protein isoform X1 n=2 Tax=Daphnia carinata TaxID=120202 RepID=UPI00257C55EE|nr:serine hydrolase-like protein isoform X1 [Daphnia carinata]
MDNCDKLVFRMQHLIPRGLSSAAPKTTNNPACTIPGIAGLRNQTDALSNTYKEVTFPMTYGNVAAKVWGPSSGIPVFALHGWLDNAGTFDTLIPMLPHNLRIVAVDIPGHGMSDHFPRDIMYHFLDCLLAVERISQQLKWEKFSFIGHSLGGCIAMLYAGVFPEKVDKLVNIDIVRVTTTRAETMHLRLRKTVGKLLKYELAISNGPEKPISYDTAVEKSINGSFGSLDRKACEIMLKRGLKKVNGGYVFSRDRRLHAAPLSFCPKQDQVVLAAKVTADVLIIKFTEGPYFESVEDQVEHIEALRKSSKNVRYVEIEGKHHTHLTHPERIANIISDFLISN